MLLLEVMEEDVEIDLVDRVTIDARVRELDAEFKQRFQDAIPWDQIPVDDLPLVEAGEVNPTIYVPREVAAELDHWLSTETRRVYGMDNTGSDLPGQGPRRVRMRWTDVADRFGINTSEDGWREAALAALRATPTIPAKRRQIIL